MANRNVAPAGATSVTAVVLVGMMGAGKSTVGELLAGLLGWRFIDLDREIERETGLSVPEIFAAQGEAAFRSLERQLTTRIASSRNFVLAPGGGWILDRANPAAMPDGTRFVWLRVSPDVAVQRISSDNRERPLLRGDRLQRARQIAAEREPLYQALGQAFDTNGRDPKAVAAEIAEWVVLSNRAP